MNIKDLYFKHFPGAGWDKFHQFLNDWDIYQPFVPHPDPETQSKIDCAKIVRTELAKNWIIQNSEILHKKVYDEAEGLTKEAFEAAKPKLSIENKVQKYRKKPVVIEAFRYWRNEPAAQDSIVEWVKSNGGMASYNEDKILIETLEGPITASLGDFIIKGVNGEFYPCKPDIFAKTYERVEEFGEASERGYQIKSCANYAGDDDVEEFFKEMEKVGEGLKKPDMYELVSESYYMLRELTEKKCQEEGLTIEKLAVERKAMIDSMTEEDMIAQVNMTNSAIDVLKQQRPDFPIELISDGYHTFKELYEFRMLYNAALFNTWANYLKRNPDREINDPDKSKPYYLQDPQYSVHKSWKHHDGELCFDGGWFIVSAMLPTGLISNHYKAEYWNYFNIPEAEKALFEFDGHTSEDVIKRLTGFILTL